MIIGIGIDSVDIVRFSDWHAKSQNELLRIFHPEEIAYCLNIPAKAAERFAARFAAREAFFKAASDILENTPFLTVCKNIWVKKLSSGKPILHVNWQLLGIEKQPTVHLSLTHAHTIATALVIIEK